MERFSTRPYSIGDFIEWNQRGQLILEPRFQRRSVWTEKAKSFLMDSIIRGKPLPKFFIRQIKHPDTNVTIREVVDGQQRLRTIFSYIDNGFKVSKFHNKEFGGKFFGNLPSEVQNSIENYELAVDLLIGAEDQDVLDIFDRLNSYSVTLNAQEKRHAEFVGEFKYLAQKLSNEYLNFWRDNKIFTDRQIARMLETELTSELIIAMIDGIQAKKAIDKYYRLYDEKLPNSDKISNRFRNTMDVIGEMTDGIIPETRFRRGLMFYSLYCSIYHFLYKLPRMGYPRVKIRKIWYPRIREALEKVDNVFYKDEDGLSLEEAKFINAASRATTDAPNRKLRSKYICKAIYRAYK